MLINSVKIQMDLSLSATMLYFTLICEIILNIQLTN